MSAADLAFADPAPTRAPVRAAANAAARQTCQVAVIGAGPYGLAMAAHLKAAGVETLAFGDAMAFWRNNMPRGMRLRSPWRATHIADPDNELSLDDYARRVGIAPTEQMPIAEFVRYGTWFQNRAVPDLDPRKVASVKPAPNGFRLDLTDGSVVMARRVVVAMGLANQSFCPDQFVALPSELVSHSSVHTDFSPFRDKRVVVIGRGQSAMESAVLLAEAGAEVELVSRGDVHWLGWQPAGTEPSGALARRLREVLTSWSEVGPFPLDWAADSPGLLHRLPGDVRTWVTVRCLRPAASGWLRPRAGDVKLVPGRTVTSAERERDRLLLRLDDGTSSLVDHLLLATGYRIDIARLGILAPELIERVDRIEGSPRLSAGFETSVAGLHFVGSSAVRSFGPLMRFIAGAGYAARCVARSVLASRS